MAYPGRGGFGCSKTPSLLIIRLTEVQVHLQRLGAGPALQRPGSREAARATIAKSVRILYPGARLRCAFQTAPGLALLHIHSDIPVDISDVSHSRLNVFVTPVAFVYYQDHTQSLSTHAQNIARARTPLFRKS